MASERYAGVLVGIPEVAKIAGVTTSAVGNWRKRHKDFPTARLQTPSGAMFDLEEVERWLLESGRINDRVPAPAILWGLVDLLRDRWAPDSMVRFVVALLVYLEVCDRAEGDGDINATEADGPDQIDQAQPLEFLLAAATRLERRNPELAGLMTDGLSISPTPPPDLVCGIVSALAAMPSVDVLRFELFEELVARHRRADRFSGDYATPDDLALLLVRLARTPAGVVLDPALGEGGVLLMAAVADERDDAQPMRLIGYDINRDAVALARARFFLYGVDAEVAVGDSLRDGGPPAADLVVLDPPLGQSKWGDADLYADNRWLYGSPPPGNADFAWLQVGAKAVGPGGVGLVLLPSGSLSRAGREGEIRRRMIQAGVVQAVIELPPRLRANTSVPLAVWILRSSADAEPGANTLLVDASALGEPGRSQYSLPEDAIDRLAAILHTWQDEGRIDEDETEIAVAVASGQLTEHSFSLQPRRYLTPPEVDVRQFQRAAVELSRRLTLDVVAMNREINGLLEALEDRR